MEKIFYNPRQKKKTTYKDTIVVLTKIYEDL